MRFFLKFGLFFYYLLEHNTVLETNTLIVFRGEIKIKFKN